MNNAVTNTRRHPSPSIYLEAQERILQKGERALLVADGEGRNSVWCAEIGLIVDAFDASPDAIAKARQLALARGVSVTYTVATLDDWDWQSEQYDIVIIICANFATPIARNRLFDNCIRTLKPGGRLILKGYSDEQMGMLAILEGRTEEQLNTSFEGFSIADHYYSEELLRETFASLDIQEIAHYHERGRRRDGSLTVEALIGMVAIKRPAAA